MFEVVVHQDAGPPVNQVSGPRIRNLIELAIKRKLFAPDQYVKT